MPPSLHSQLTQSTQIAKALIRVRILPHLAHTPGAADDGLIAGAHVAIAEGHEPRERRIFCERCRRPIEGQLDIWNGWPSGRAGLNFAVIHQAEQLFDLRQSNVSSLKSLIGAAIPLPYAVFRLLPLRFSLLLSASIKPDLPTPLTL